MEEIKNTTEKENETALVAKEESAIIPVEKGKMATKEETGIVPIKKGEISSVEDTDENNKTGVDTVNNDVSKDLGKKGKNRKKEEEPKKQSKNEDETETEKDSDEQEIYEDMLPDLAKLMNVPLEQLKNEFFLFQIRKLMGKLGKLIVRYNVSEVEIEKILYNSHLLNMGEVVISPAYLPVCGKKVKKQRINELPIVTLIDFPFGENSFKSKINNVKESIRSGVDGVSVMMPNLLATPENIKVFKKQIKKIGKAYKYKSNIVINATDLSEQEIQRVFKLVAKTKLKGVAFAFGEATLEEVKSKLSIVNRLKGMDQPIKKRRKKKTRKLMNKVTTVIANVDRADAITELFKLHVDRIITPYADQIGEELVERFKIKSVKLR